MSLLKSIPKIDRFINNKEFKGFSVSLITKISKDIITRLRNDILEKKVNSINEKDLIQTVLKEYADLTSPSLQSVINATGIIVHTNLGRSLINEESFNKAMKVATSYNNLEYDLEQGKRGERYSHIVKTLQALTGCEDAIVVNNNASAPPKPQNPIEMNKLAKMTSSSNMVIINNYKV